MPVGAPQTAAQIEARCTSLHNTFNPKGICTRTFANHHTNEPAPGGRQVSILKVGKGTNPNKQVAVIIAGLHARELAPPDAVISFVEGLLTAYDAGTAMSYPPVTVENDLGDVSSLPSGTIPWPDVRDIVERIDTYFIALLNPDGREWDLAHLGTLTDDAGNLIPGWRKNRRPNAAGGDSVGVDLNRNFPIIWRFGNYYDMAVYNSVYSGGPAGVLVTDETYRGPSANSEPETQNVKELVDSLPVRLYIDVHSYGRHVLFDWGIEDNGSDPAQTFLNSALDHQRDGLEPGNPHMVHPNYNEFVPEGESGFRTNLQHLADVMRDAVSTSSGNDAQSSYVSHNSSDLYRPTGGGPTSGASDDYTFSTQVTWSGSQGQPGPRAPIFSYTLEVGHTREGGFHPAYTSTSPAHPNKRTYPKIEREVHFALGAGLVWLARFRAAPPAPPPAPPAHGGSSSICSCSVALDTAKLRPVINFLRRVRDDELGATPAGRHFADWLQRRYRRVSPPLAGAMTAFAPLHLLVRHGLVLPMAGLVAASSAAVRPIRGVDARVQTLRTLLVLSLVGYVAALVVGLVLTVNTIAAIV